jgi:hypothetical protein
MVTPELLAAGVEHLIPGGKHGLELGCRHRHGERQLPVAVTRISKPCSGPPSVYSAPNEGPSDRSAAAARRHKHSLGFERPKAWQHLAQLRVVRVTGINAVEFARIDRNQNRASC